MKADLILNKNSGGNRNKSLSIKEIKNKFFDLGVSLEIHELSGNDLQEKCRELTSSRTDLIVAAGGDGTLSTVAEILAGTDIPLGVLPFGTLNNFARDLGIPLEIEKAISAIAKGKPRRIDVGEVNGRIFINNSSVGLYPEAVKLRDEYMHHIGGRKWLAMTIASLSVFTRFPLFDISLRLDDRSIHYTTPFVFIGNNEYQVDLFQLGSRNTFTGGRLSLYTASCTGRLNIIRLAFLVLINRLNQDKDFEFHSVKEVLLKTGKNRVKVSMDGEVHYLEPPLHYKIREKHLKVIHPQEVRN